MSKKITSFTCQKNFESLQLFVFYCSFLLIARFKYSIFSTIRFIPRNILPKFRIIYINSITLFRAYKKKNFSIISKMSPSLAILYNSNIFLTGRSTELWKIRLSSHCRKQSSEGRLEGQS